MDKKPFSYWRMFCATFALSAFTFGGGFVMIPLMKQKFVDKLGWLGEDEILDLTAIAQASPGAIAVNASILLGYRVAGFCGALVCIVGTVLPPLIILSIVSLFYQAFRAQPAVAAVLRGMQAGVSAVICDVVITMGSGVLRARDVGAICVMLAAFCLVYFLRVNVIYVILACALFGLARGWIERRRAGK